MTADPDLALQTYDIQGSLQKDSQVTCLLYTSDAADEHRDV